MVFVLLTIMCTVCLVLTFKFYEQYNIPVLPAIVVNYFMCFFLAIVHENTQLNIASIIAASWFPYTLILGVLFVSTFYLMAYVTQRNGVKVTAVAAKLSVVIPIIIAYIFYGDEITLIKILGIICALIAVVLISLSDKKDIKKNLIAPFFVFVMSGIVDATLNFIQRSFLDTMQYNNLFLMVLFFVAGSVGLLACLFQKISFNRNIIIAGTILGIPNYYSIYFFLKSFQNTDFDIATLMPIINIGIVLGASLFAFLWFKERFLTQHIFGLILSLLSIILLFR